jgi:hypothetical protein
MQREHCRFIHTRIYLYTTRVKLAAMVKLHILFCGNDAPNRRRQVLVLHARLDRPSLSEWSLTSSKVLHDLRANCVSISTHGLTTLRTSFTSPSRSASDAMSFRQSDCVDSVQCRGAQARMSTDTIHVGTPPCLGWQEERRSLCPGGKSGPFKRRGADEEIMPRGNRMKMNRIHRRCRAAGYVSTRAPGGP